MSNINVAGDRSNSGISMSNIDVANQPEEVVQPGRRFSRGGGLAGKAVQLGRRFSRGGGSAEEAVQPGRQFSRGWSMSS